MATQRSFRPLLQHLQHGLKSFQESQVTFEVLASVNPATLQTTTSITIEDEPPRTLFILDSSFNPPSIAHQTLAETALHETTSDAYAKPHRLLLLFSTMNADKAASAVSFDQRLTMMAIFATDLLAKIKEHNDFSVIPVDIGVTTAPYYTDKSIAIEKEGPYGKSKHVHLLGYDTLTRVFNAKYYSKFNPPFSALNPYFDSGHELRATLRPDGDGSVKEQESFLTKLESGALDSDGGNREWARQVHLVPPNPKTGVSSTKIRQAAQQEDWLTVKQLCPPSIAQWTQSQRLYGDDSKDTKMA